MLAAAAAVGLAPLLYRLPALHSDPGVLTLGLLFPALAAYTVHAVLSRAPADPGGLGLVVGFDLLWWAASAVFHPDPWLAVRRTAIALPLAVQLLTGLAVAVALVLQRRNHPRRFRHVLSLRRPPAPVWRTRPAASIDLSMPGPDGVPRPSYVLPRGEERDGVLAAEARRYTLQGPAGRLAPLMNTALDEAEAGRHPVAIVTLGEVLSRFDHSMQAQPDGYNHLFPLQSGAAIALVRQATSWRALGQFDEALRSYERAYARFHGAMEEQAGEEDWYARQWAAEAQLRRGDLLAELGRSAEAIAAWRSLLPSRQGFVWPSLTDWADEAADRIRRGQAG